MRSFRIIQSVSLCIALCVWAPAQLPPKEKAPAGAQAAKPKPSPHATNTKLSDGRYELQDPTGASGAFADEWELWKTPTGQRVVENWSVIPPGSQNKVNLRLELELIAGHAVSIRVIGQTGVGKDLECRFTMNKAVCAAGEQRKEVEVSGNYDFFLPSPWLLRGVVKRSKKNPANPTPVTLVRMGGITAEGPQLVVHAAKVQYIGEDDVEVAGVRRKCEVYELQPDPHPRMLIWLDRKNDIVVVTQDAKKSQQRIELVRYSAAGGTS